MGPGAANPHERSNSPVKKILILPQKRQYYREVLTLTFWKVSLKGRVFTFIRVPPITVVIITGRAVVVIVAVVAAAVVMAPGKGSGENPKKSSPRREKGVPSGLPMRKGAQVGVISAPFNALPT